MKSADKIALAQEPRPESRRPEYKEPSAAGVMAVFGGLTCVSGIFCLIASASETGSALAIIGVTAILGGILYFCLSSAFSLLARTAHYTGLACWHLEQLRKENGSGIYNESSDDAARAPKKNPAQPIVENIQPYRL